MADEKDLEDPYGFPSDLKDLQARLHRARADYAALVRTLPWSVEPLPGWPGTARPHSDEVTGGREPSPGYTPQQAAEEARLRALVTDLSVEVSTHPYWSGRSGPELVTARMALKHHTDALTAAAAAGDVAAAA